MPVPIISRILAKKPGFPLRTPVGERFFKMQGRDFKPPEEKTSPISFFILGLIMVAVTFWTVWDEAFTRRPWKQYQKQFNAYEKAQVEKELARLKKTTGSAVAELDQKIAAQEQKLAGDEELKKLKEELTKSELDAFEQVQELGFRKALFDQSYFYLQEAIRQGHDKEAEQKEVDEAKALLDEITPVAAKAEAARDAIKAKIEAKEKELKRSRRRGGKSRAIFPSRSVGCKASPPAPMRSASSSCANTSATISTSL